MTTFTIAPLPCGCGFTKCKYHYEWEKQQKRIIGTVAVPLSVEEMRKHFDPTYNQSKGGQS